ncbi:MAG: hypothetical protein PVJ67_05690 [Candidatus Pacearchaeota archaeon]|jgi:hypothetical protein
MKRGLVILVFILSVCFVSAIHVAKINGGNSVSVEEGQAYYYNFSIENTGSGNITLVNITLPSGLHFRATTEITDAFFQTFINTSDTLTWNNSANYLIGSTETKHFAFVGEAKTQGIYQIIILTDGTDGEYSSAIELEIFSIENSSCISNWSCGAWSGCEDNFQTRTCTDLDSCNDTSTKPLEQRYCSAETCLQNWSCGAWSGCAGGIQTRTCLDLNSCNNLTGKPNETQSCLGNCVPAYSCTDWLPEKCDKTQTQTRICTDSNNCGSALDKPEESRECKADSHLFFIILVSVIVTVILFFGITLFIKIRKIMKEKNSQNFNLTENNPSKQPNQKVNKNNPPGAPLKIS